MDIFYAIKKNQIHAYNTEGKRLFVSKLLVKPVTVTQVKHGDKDGYEAIQVGVLNRKRINKPLAGHTKTSQITPRYVREIRLSEASDKKVGDQITVSQIFELGDTVTVSAVSKGKGFAGGMKRWGFSGGPKTHGQSDRQRSPGSIGQGTTPGRVYKGKRMAGQMGNQTITISGSQIVHIDEAANELWLTGAIPGPKDGLVLLCKKGKKKFVALQNQNTEATTVEEVQESNQEPKAQESEAKPAEETVVEEKTQDGEVEKKEETK
ncbi:50S ribosomal protein L3 [Candidatus Beckwithbacteria bacterium]|nr:50S ribosomal protein L3 [Candidatus Beckwithbacteria bacterium]